MKLPNLILLLFSLLFTQFEETSKEEANTDNVYEFKSAVVVPLSHTVEEAPEKLKDVKHKENNIEDTQNKEEYMFFELTAYSNHFKSTGKNEGDEGYGITASGVKTKAGVTIAADWRILPKGTRVWIEGIGERVVHDKGGAIKGKKIDVYFEKEEDAEQFGRKKDIKVMIIEKGE